MKGHWSASAPFRPSYAALLDIPDPTTIPEEVWVAADDPIREVLECIHPTMDSEERRKDVTEYMQKLIKSTIGVEVFPYGSVPLRTYLPEGDIDLAAISDPFWEDVLPQAILRVLHAEAQSGNAEFEIKEIQFIDAEVKLVKCVVQDIVIDISFNQLGGLCSLCFLEQVDQVVDKDHLFKRSIILIKAWCYYESRILGAYYGFLSTYALEVLVLYIFQNFHAYLTSPLMVLYVFLSYYSQFDWDNYCISMSGPIIRSLLPKLVVEKPIRRGALLRGKELKKCLDMFRVPFKASEKIVRDFTPKHLNIIDPLKLSNNLGRSVNLGNSYHIRSAFRLGAQKLGEILELPMEDIGDGIKKFFVNTLQMHQRKHVPDFPIIFGSISFTSVSPIEAHDEDADLDKYLSGLDDELPVESSNVDDPSTLDLKTGNHDIDNRNMDTMRGYENVQETSNVYVRKKDASGDDNEPDEVLNPLATLAGDYDSQVRSLLYGQTCHGFDSFAAKIRATTQIELEEGGQLVPFHPRCLLFRGSSSCLQGNPYCAVMRHPLYATGHRPGDTFHCEKRNTARGTGPYIPRTSFSTRGWESNGEPPLPTRALQPVHGGSEEVSLGLEGSNMGPNPCEPSQPHGCTLQVKNSERKLMFGSFGPPPESTSNAMASWPNVVCSKTERFKVDAFRLKDEEEFPPLST